WTVNQTVTRRLQARRGPRRCAISSRAMVPRCPSRRAQPRPLLRQPPPSAAAMPRGTLAESYHRPARLTWEQLVATSAPTIQLFGLESDRATRAALRFFKERRTPISFVDL